MTSFPPMPPPVSSQMNMGLKPHRGGLILGLGIGGLAINLLSCLGNAAVPGCGLVGLLGLVASIFAWVMGNNDLREMQSGTMDRSGEGMTKGGKVCGIINVVLAIIGVVLTLLLIFGVLALFGAAAAAGAGGQP